ncbi:hypothetical protein B0H10DRAFT_2106570, partial [Mycena sp. CBHHK59/15]
MFSLSLNAWTSSNGYVFIAMVLHWVDNKGELQECLIDFAELVSDHSGETMATTVWETLHKYNLQAKLAHSHPINRRLPAEDLLGSCPGLPDVFDP